MNIKDIEKEFDDWEEDEEEIDTVKSLFCDRLFSSVPMLLLHDLEEFSFDFDSVRAELGRDFNSETSIMLVNFIRAQVKERLSTGVLVDREYVTHISDMLIRREFISDTNMLPALENDSLLFLLSEHFQLDTDFEEEEEIKAATYDRSATQGIDSELAARYQSLVSLITSPSDPESRTEGEDGYYFDSYGHLSIHEQMLRDEPRTNAYAAALISNADFVKGKVVLDVGCGTGILSIVAARAGAKRVIGVDCSSIINQARKIVDRNGLSDRITLVQGKLEELKLPLEEGEVDIVVSEWMGYGLYFENMLSSVIYARDTYLSETGILMPSDAMIYVEAMTAHGESDRIAYWRDVYSFDMSDLVQMFCAEAQVDRADPELVISNRCRAHLLSIEQAQNDDLDFYAPFQLVIAKDSTLRAFILSFDVVFGGGLANVVTLSTGTSSDPTHWKQTITWLEPKNYLELTSGQRVEGRINYQRSRENSRDYDITVHFKIQGSDSDEISQKFSLHA